jgi:3-oxoacyl-(acyl-carrier-protein) synthase
MVNSNIPQPVIVSYQALTALGNLDETWQALMAGQSGLRPVQLPEVPTSYPAGAITSLGEEYGTTKRVKNLLRLGLTISPELVKTAQECDIIIATTKGAVDELLYHPQNPSGQPWHLNKMIAEHLASTGNQQTVSAACASGSVALIQAAKRIMTGTSDCVVVIGIDLLSSFVMAGFDALKGLSMTPCKPFDENRDGLSLGEGIGIIVLCSNSYAEQNDLSRLAGFTGW